MLFNGEQIWGSIALREHGPVPSRRNMRTAIPGIDGFRVYKLGMDKVTWEVSGRLVDFSRAGLTQQLWKGANYQLDGNLYTFVDRAGISYEYCELTSYEPEGVPAGVTLNGNVPGVTVRVHSLVTWAAPRRV